MSTGKRAYDILRAYASYEWDQLHPRGANTQSEEQELQQALDQPWTIQKPNTAEAPSLPEMPTDPVEKARAMLGVKEGDDFQTIHGVYADLMKRSRPDRFPAGSEERFKAERIRRFVQEAYKTLTDKMDPTERRFGSLELD